MPPLELITDLAEIKQKSIDNWNENVGFRVFLKGLSLSTKEIDAIVHQIFEQVNAQIDCTQCANCCRVTNAFLGTKDITRAAAGLGISRDAFIDRYLKENEAENRLEFKSVPCPLLAGNLCTIYENRPKDCREFPHLHKKGFATRTIRVISNCEICPIVFNVWELLKKEFVYFYSDDDFDDIW